MIAECHWGPDEAGEHTCAANSPGGPAINAWHSKGERGKSYGIERVVLSMLKICVIKIQGVRHSWIIESTFLKWSTKGFSELCKETREGNLDWENKRSRA